MNRRRLLALIGVCIAVPAIVAAAAAQSSVAPDAERVARVYTRAFFAGDVKTAADLTDPRTIERVRESFLSELVKVTDPDAEKAILGDLGLARTTAELSKVDGKTLYIAITERDLRKNPAALEAMKRTHVEILGSVSNPAGGVTVLVRTSAPMKDGVASKESGLLMRRVLGDWKVVSNVP